MRFYAETLGLPRGAEALLCDLIHERTGLFFDTGKQDLLIDKLAPLVVERGFNSFLDYYYWLKYDAGAEQEWGQVMDALSVQETYFWREIDQVTALVEILMPELIARFGQKGVRIWSAPCATGEEPLTIAMALNEAGWFDRAQIEIYGSDASRGAIEKAQQGFYRPRSFRNLSPALRDKYFQAEDGGWRVKPDLHARIQWRVTNLINHDEARRMAAVPVIFCRNVFIYFSAEMVRRTVRLFAELIPRSGYLCVGSSESLLKLTDDFELQEIGGAFIYVRK
ncbi:MAG TPA: protein-glutamate O-methyltransferase CheR [Blastocatellia bacterium]|nr:protein-glutamate O-methyltransferase CheR [Blastocatellia bacterium]